MVRFTRKGRCSGALVGLAAVAALLSAARPSSGGCAFAGTRAQTNLRQGCARAAANPATVVIPASVNGGSGYEIDKEYLAEWAAAGVKAEENTNLVQTGGAIAIVVLAIAAFFLMQSDSTPTPAKAPAKATPTPVDAAAAEPAVEEPAAEAAAAGESESAEEVVSAAKVAAEALEEAAVAKAPKAAPEESDSSKPKVKEAAKSAK